MKAKTGGFWSTVWLVMLSVGLSAQTPQAPQKDTPARPTFRVRVDLVRTDVVPRDDRGNFVADLTKSDFEVYEDGVKQDLTGMVLSHGGRVTNVLVPPAAMVTEGLILPPPQIRGHLSHVAIVGDRLVQKFSSTGASPKALPPRPDAASRNYIYFSGSVITFGRLTMKPADLQLIDSDPKDPFDFFPSKYQGQLVAGYSKNTPSGALRTYMPDYGDLARVKDLVPGQQNPKRRQ